jgi:hypothetical protein
MKLKPTTSFNDAVRRLAEGNHGAATVLAHIHKEYPEHAMKYLHALDEQGIYGVAIWNAYHNVYGGDISVFLERLSAGEAAEDIRKGVYGE